MKLLTIMAALLISFSAFSQDLIEYRDFKFYQNGAEISIEEVTELTKEYGVSKVAFRQGRRDYAASQNSLIMTRRNLTNGTLTILCYGGAFSSFAIGYLQATGGFSGNADPAYYIPSFTLGTISTGGMIYYFSLLNTKEGFKKRADKKLSQTAQKLNEAIQSGKSE